MTSPQYENRIVDCQQKVDFGKLAGKTVVLTGGSSGLGLGYVQMLVNVGAFVVFGDIKPPAENLSDKATFVQCDVVKWEDQARLFKVAKEKSPNGGIDVVIANAGIYGPDTLDGLTDDEPSKPQTKVLDVNLLAVLYTTKLAGCIMGYIDTQGSSVYSVSKHGVRGLMTCLRRKGLIRVNCLAPWFIATPIMPESFIKSAGAQFRAKGVDFALAEDAATAVARLATDTSINGRTLGIVPRQLSPSGYLDLDRDDFDQGTPLHKLQSIASSLVYGDLATW